MKGERALADTQGSPVAEHVDPTANVLALVEAANKRQDDLRQAEAKYLDARLNGLEREAVLRAEMADMRAGYEDKLRTSESKRIDAIRLVDVQNAAATADQARVAVATLATAAAQTAETLRASVATSAAAGAAQTNVTTAALTDRIAQLEKAQYTGAGKEAVIDPQTARLALAVEQLTRARASDMGKSSGLSMAWVALGGVVSLIAGLLFIAGVLYAVLKP